MNHNQAITTFENYIRARYPIVSLVSYEETRVITAVRAIARSMGYKVAEWTFTRGMTLYEYRDSSKKWEPMTGSPINPDGTRDPAAAFESMLAYAKMYYGFGTNANPTLFVMKDLHNILATKRPDTIRYLRDVAAAFEMTKHNLVLVSPSFITPPDLEKTVAVLDWPLPDADDLALFIDRAISDLKPELNKLNGHRENVVQALRGLTGFEAESVLLTGIVQNGCLSDDVIPVIVREKAQIIRKSGVLEFYDQSVSMTEVGGLQNLKQYAAEVRSAFSKEAAAHGVDTPKGVLLVGVPGTGKSLSAKAIAGGKMPLLRMDIGALMGGLVGQSEGNMRQALKTAEAVAPCVVWIDEIEKGLGGIGGGEHDGGTSQRVFGTLLTWMQETTAPVYVVATANDVRSLRPELIRRFDDVFWVDLPDRESRREILKVHLSKRGYDALPASGTDQIITFLHGFSGAEIEKVVKSAIKTAYFEGAKLSTAHLLAASRQIVPVAVTMDRQIDELRRWAENRARQAGNPLETQSMPEPDGRRVAEL